MIYFLKCNLSGLSRHSTVTAPQTNVRFSDPRCTYDRPNGKFKSQFAFTAWSLVYWFSGKSL